MDLPADIEEALALAGGNRRELKAVLRHYRQDSLKFRAACFLIANMRWHYSDDSGYCLYSDAKDSDLCDLRRFDRSFLISHVDHAFDVWESSPCAAGLSFCEFCEYILPYRSLAGYPDCFSGAELYDLFGKYVGAGQGDSLAGYVARYNRVKTDFEGVTGKRSALDSSLYRPFFPGRECTDVAVIGCQILRACGLPVMVEFCNAYRDFPGRHFYCTVRDDRGRWWPFNPETSLPGEGKSLFSESCGRICAAFVRQSVFAGSNGRMFGGFPGNSSLDRACEESVGLFSGISGLGRYGAGDLG